MDIIDYLKPKYVLMENVVDILKFAGGFLGRYAIGRLVALNYQARMGIMAAGSYGLPQFRMRVFLWGARTTEVCHYVVVILVFLGVIYKFNLNVLNENVINLIIFFLLVEIASISITNT